MEKKTESKLAAYANPFESRPKNPFLSEDIRESAVSRLAKNPKEAFLDAALANDPRDAFMEEWVDIRRARGETAPKVNKRTRVKLTIKESGASGDAINIYARFDAETAKALDLENKRWAFLFSPTGAKIKLTEDLRRRGIKPQVNEGSGYVTVKTGVSRKSLALVFGPSSAAKIDMVGDDYKITEDGSVVWDLYAR